ncbi:hypothetical protein NW767_005855 [Fusarium falciforme]|nr:hypothetical protein NW767_005855 [Fusarium falciforme]KAJ4253563.1 hypothetical protein NW757_005515 [Fusarium falciforme]
MVRGHTGAVATYMKWQIALREFTMPGSRIPKKHFLATKNYTLIEFQHVLTGTRETLHLCDFAYCINPTHLTIESHANNMDRGKCFAQARSDAEKGMKIRKHCAVHSPPCLLQLACEPSTGKIITEYESLGNPAVQDLPPQTKPTKGPALLATNIRIVS